MFEISGLQISQRIVEKLKREPKPSKILAAVLVGNNSASASFLKQKEKLAKELGIDFRIYKFENDSKNDALRQEVGRLAKQKPVGGIIIQLPLPEHINRHYVLNAIPQEKDIDVLGERALGNFYTVRNPVLPPAVGVVEDILGIMNKELKIMKIIIIGSGFLVGKPIATWLQNKVAELTIFNEYTQDLQNKLKNADLIISGVGKANLFRAEDLSENTTVIDFGYDMSGSKISGDFNPIIHNSRLRQSFGGQAKFTIYYTPTPGGTGPILVAKLLENFYKLTSLSVKIPK